MLYHRFQIRKHSISISRGWKGLAPVTDITDNVKYNEEGTNEDNENADENTETDLDHVEVDLPVVPRS